MLIIQVKERNWQAGVHKCSVVHEWTRPSSEAVNGNTIESFNMRVDRFMDENDRWY